MPKVVLVRHGKTKWNEEGRYQGKVDVPLSAEGAEQARKVGLALKHLPVKAVYSSPLSRCVETAKEIARHHSLEVVQVEELKEINHGEWEGMLAKEVERKYPELLRLWKEKPAVVKMPGEGGESLQDVYERVTRALKEILSKHSEDELVVVVSHDATNKVAMCHFLGVDLNKFWAFKQANCGITVVEYSPKTGRVIVHVANATSHLGVEIDFEVQKAL